MLSHQSPPRATSTDDLIDHDARGSVSAPTHAAPRTDAAGLLMTVEQVAELWFGEIGEHGSASSNCQKIRRLIPDVLPARRIGNRWYVNRAIAKAWANGSDPASVMAHPDTREAQRAHAGRGE
jgi:hypothetical protein